MLGPHRLAQGLVVLAGLPEVEEHHGELACHSHHGALLIPPSPAAMELIRSIIATEDYVESPLNAEVAGRAGEIWAARLRDAADPDAVRVYLESPLTVALGTGDAIMATFPLGADGFVVFGLDRERGRPDFTEAECSRVRELLPALAPPLRRFGAHHGLVGGRYRLSPREVEVSTSSCSRTARRNRSPALWGSPRAAEPRTLGMITAILCAEVFLTAWDAMFLQGGLAVVVTAAAASAVVAARGESAGDAQRREAASGMHSLTLPRRAEPPHSVSPGGAPAANHLRRRRSTSAAWSSWP